jgi:hypothetical protein
MDERIEAFVKDILALEGQNSNVVRESVRRHLAVYEAQFRDAEPDARKRAQQPNGSAGCLATG